VILARQTGLELVAIRRPDHKRARLRRWRIFAEIWNPSQLLIRPFTTLARPAKEGPAFRSNGSIGFFDRPRGEARVTNLPIGTG
jgi:hypothetical protein